MNGRLIARLGGIAVLWLGGSVVLAQPVDPGRGGPPDGPLPGPALRALQLTEQQEESARQIFEQSRPQMEALHKEMRESRQLIDEALESGQADPTAVGELVIAGHALRQEERRLREESKAALKSLLTAEQQAKLEALEALREDRGPRGRRPGPEGLPHRWGPPGRGPEDGEK